ncbi:MAG: hypothetical protein IPF53_22775 [Blastocatellia bacterium]|nr:hypothetical protein [Blastocatellia bacterium]
MSSAQDPRMDTADLYREELITDRKMARFGYWSRSRWTGPSIPAGTPLRRAGPGHDSDGALPISFEIPGKTLAEAVTAYPAGLRKAIAETERELQELRRQASRPS